MVEIVWEEPPATALSQGRRGQYHEFAEALREHPKRWALLPTTEERTPKGASATAQNIRAGKVKAFPKGEFETAVDGLTVYVRYVGSPDSQPADAEPEGEALDPAEVRAWARRNGYEVPDRGRLSGRVLEAYHQHLEEEQRQP